ncbi:MAG: SGNH/GDSL hydrolase family protein [Pseudomonadota bacterium]
MGWIGWAGAGLGAAGLVLLAVAPAAPRGQSVETGPADAQTRVLWIGNSHTHRHDLPGRVAAMLAATGHPTFILARTANDMRLQDHLSEGWPAAALPGPWDVMILQAHSVGAQVDPGGFLQALDRILALKALPSRVLLYQNWAYRRGRADFYRANPDETPASVQDEIDALFAYLPSRYAVEVIPTGRALHEAAIAGQPVIDPDGNHLTAEGAQLAAEMIAASLLAPSQ